ncbi:MAG: GNAT family N-acetyltransferase [Clostridiales bacterium]|mgnify:FL=1|nr:GNAT family N-acetyltransferase [Clostridiales bacterium]
MKIISFKSKYRDDLIFMILEAKNALGRVPGLNPDLLDIKSNYFDKGDMFWIALDDNDRVIGSVGYNTNKNPKEVTLHRLFVKCNLKRQGIGSVLLQKAEEYIKDKNKETIFINLGVGEEWFESKLFYKKHGYVEYEPNKMKKSI